MEGVERCVMGGLVVGRCVVGGSVEDCGVETLVEGEGLVISHGNDGKLNLARIPRGMGISVGLEGSLGEGDPLWPGSGKVVKPA